MYSDNDKVQINHDEVLLNDFKELIVQISKDIMNMGVFDEIEKIHRDMDRASQEIMEYTAKIEDFYKKLEASGVALPIKVAEIDRSISELEKIYHDVGRTSQQIMEFTEKIKDFYQKLETSSAALPIKAVEIARSINEVNGKITSCLRRIDNLGTNLRNDVFQNITTAIQNVVSHLNQIQSQLSSIASQVDIVKRGIEESANSIRENNEELNSVLETILNEIREDIHKGHKHIAKLSHVNIGILALAVLLLLLKFFY